MLHSKLADEKSLLLALSQAMIADIIWLHLNVNNIMVLHWY